MFFWFNSSYITPSSLKIKINKMSHRAIVMRNFFSAFLSKGWKRHIVSRSLETIHCFIPWHHHFCWWSLFWTALGVSNFLSLINSLKIRSWSHCNLQLLSLFFDDNDFERLSVYFSKNSRNSNVLAFWFVSSTVDSSYKL